MDYTTYFGRPAAYWQELQARFEKLHARPAETADLLQEIGELRGRLSYYESRVRELATFLNRH